MLLLFSFFPSIVCQVVFLKQCRTLSAMFIASELCSTANKIHRLRGRCALDKRLQLIPLISAALQTFKVTVTRVAPNEGTCFALAKVQGKKMLNNNSIRVARRLPGLLDNVRVQFIESSVQRLVSIQRTHSEFKHMANKVKSPN